MMRQQAAMATKRNPPVEIDKKEITIYFEISIPLAAEAAMLNAK